MQPQLTVWAGEGGSTQTTLPTERTKEVVAPAEERQVKRKKKEVVWRGHIAHEGA